MIAVPRLSIGLPVYNGERYLAEALDALLGQSFADFELIIADNASTDGTAELCSRYAEQDPRVRYFRHAQNIGQCPNHDFVFRQARGEYFKWASHDDLYARHLLLRCVEALDDNPEAVLSHAPTAMIDGAGRITESLPYVLSTDSRQAPERFRSVLFVDGGDDIYGVIRTEVLRRIPPQGSYHHSDRTFVAELALHGPFVSVPEWLYFRRDHPERALRAAPTVRMYCTRMDPRRGNGFRHPTARLLAEYVLGFVAAIRRAPITSRDRRHCCRHLGRWLASRALPGPTQRSPEIPRERLDPPTFTVEAVVAGQQGGAR
jgi:glycosyltransferase involved in cell wall biosynthesis